MSDDNKLIFEFEKNQNEKVRVHLCSWHDSNYVDVRIWYRQNGNEDASLRPSHKGIRVHCELISDLITGLRKAETAAGMG